jgi:putative hydroxymethylpyrimidine transport system ATP-binding protein
MQSSAAFARAQSAPGISISGLRLRHGVAPLFENFDLAVRGGETTCLLGTSGVGKSTLLRLIAGLVTPEAGSIAATDAMGLGGRVAYMDQSDLLLPWLKIGDNVAVGAILRREPIDSSRVGSLLDAVGLGVLAQAMPATLSGGMRQRVALARTLYEARPVVLLDEPFGALDALTRLRLQDLTAELLRGKTVVLVTHDPTEVMRLGHRVVVLRGQPVQMVEPVAVPAMPPPRGLADPGVVAAQAPLLAALDVDGGGS